MLATNGSAVDKLIVMNQTDDWNRSDMDMATMADGRKHPPT